MKISKPSTPSNVFQNSFNHQFDLGTAKEVANVSSPNLFSLNNHQAKPFEDSVPVGCPESPLSSLCGSPKCEDGSFGGQSDMETLVATSEAILVKIIRRALSIQAFRSMPRSDQHILILENWAPIFLLHATFAGSFCDAVYNLVSVSKVLPICGESG